MKKMYSCEAEDNIRWIMLNDMKVKAIKNSLVVCLINIPLSLPTKKISGTFLAYNVNKFQQLSNNKIVPFSLQRGEHSLGRCG